MIPFVCNALSHLFLCSSSDTNELRRIAFENHVLGWTLGFAKTWKCDWGMGRLGIVPKQRRGDMAWRCCSWKPTSSKFFLKKIKKNKKIPCKVSPNLHRPNQYNIHFFLLSFTQRLMSSLQNQKFEGMWLLEHNPFFKPLHVGAGVHMYSSQLWSYMHVLYWPRTHDNLSLTI